MKAIILLIAAVLLVCEVQATSIAVPSLGEVVRNADTIVKGRLSVDGNDVVLLIESSIKGKYRPAQTVRIMATPEDMFFDLSHYATQLQAQSCFVLGNDRNNKIYMPFSAFSVWPQGISKEWPVFEDIGKCATFIDRLVNYEHLESDPNTLLTSLLNGLKSDDSRPAVLAYLNSSPSLFMNDRSLGRDILSVVAAYISSLRIYDEWTASCMRSLSPSMPQSITIPYFMEVAKKGGRQGSLAKSAVEAALKVRGVIERDVEGLENLSAIVVSVLPKLRDADAQKNAHLFDSVNSDIAASAGLVFSVIFSEPRPKAKDIIEEKTFWMNRMSY